MKLYHYALFGVFAGLVGCNDNDDMVAATPVAAKVMFEVTVTNETAGQPFSPMTLVAHSAAKKFWMVGEAVSVGLEDIAESGSPTTWRNTLKTDSMVYMTKEGKGLILPGKMETFTVELSETELMNGAELSLASMLGKTNDGLVLMSGQKLNMLKQGDSTSVRLLSYDAGTEMNRETQATLGALGGEGMNAVRDDRANQLTLHTGVVSKDDGLSTSALTQLEKWDHSVAKVEIKRL